MTMDELISVTEAANLLEVSRTWVLQLIDEEKLEGKKVGNNYVINIESVKRYRREVQGKDDI